MADVASSLNSWSSTASSNSPNDNTTIGQGLADNLQAIQAVVRGDLAAVGTAISSSANPDVGAVNGLYHSVTGTATITGLGSSATAGIWKIFKTESTPQFTHSTALQMVGGVDYVAAAGDILSFMCEATNQWKCVGGSPFAPPAGVIMDYAGSTAPSGWLECNGTAVSRTTYSRLFSAISTTWGTGDGSTTFNLPNLRGRIRVGRGTGVLSENCTAGAVSTGSDTFTVTSNNDKWVTGMSVQASTSGSLPAGVSAATAYYVIRASATTIKLATSLANAQNGTAVDLTTAGTGTHTITHNLLARTIGEYGGEETHAMSLTELLAHTHVIHNRQNFVSTGYNSPVTGSNTELETMTTDASGGNGAMNNMQPYGVVMAIIKT